jgi:hypothetical protein
MSTLLNHVIGTDSVFVFPVITTNNETNVVGPTDVTGAYFYFEIFAADGVTAILTKDNDPAGANAGITIRSPGTLGEVEVKVEHTDLAGATPGSSLAYKAKVRLDPTGADDRYRVSSGVISIEAEGIAVP